MAQYIDKAKIAEQIDRARQACSKVACNPKNEESSDYYLGKAQAYQEMQYFLDTLEVKEVVEPDYSNLNILLRYLGVDPDTCFGKSLQDAVFKGLIQITKKGEQL